MNNIAPPMLLRSLRWLLAVAVVAAALLAFVSEAHSASEVTSPSDIPLTLGVDVATGLEEAAPIEWFDALAEKRAAIVQDVVAWKYRVRPSANQFPSAEVEAAYSAESLPDITWSPTIFGDSSRAQASMSLASIIGGSHDTYIRQFARAAATMPGPILLRFAPDMNVSTSNYAEINSGNRAGQFVKAWRHVWSIFQAVGAKNVQWVWSPHVGSGRRSLEELYPGDAYVNWVGLNALSDRSDSCAQLPKLIRPSLASVETFSSRPIMLSAAGVSSACADKASLISQLFSWLETEPSVRSITWAERGTYSIDTDLPALAAFQTGVKAWDPAPKLATADDPGAAVAQTNSSSSSSSSSAVAAGTSTSAGATMTPGQAVNTSEPNHVIGDGQPASCTSAAVVSAVAAGGITTFDCGPKPLTITMTATADVPNTDHLVVLDGGGLVTLSGAGVRQILFSDTCQGTWSTDDCVDQQYPQIVVQNITFEDGYSGAEQNPSCTQNTPACWYGGVDGGGAVYVEGGQFTAVNSNFTDNSCYSSGPDLGGGAIRALAQYESQPVYITNDTFTGNYCSNGGALSSISTEWDITGSDFSDNSAVGFGANPAAQGTQGGGSGGAIYLDGVDDNVEISDTEMAGNTAREGGGAVFDVVDKGYGSLSFDDSQLSGNDSGEFQTAPGIYYLVDGEHEQPVLTDSTDQ